MGSRLSVSESVFGEKFRIKEKNKAILLKWLFDEFVHRFEYFQTTILIREKISNEKPKKFSRKILQLYNLLI